MSSECAYSATSCEIRASAAESAIVQPLLAWQDGDRLFIRRLMLAPITKRQSPTGSKRRTRFEFGGYLFGCVLQGALQFARGKGRTAATAVSALRQCLGPAWADLATCSGCDAAALRLGMGARRGLCPQLRLLKENALSKRVDIRHDNHASAALGVSACLFFLFNIVLRDDLDCDPFRIGALAAAEAAKAGLDRWSCRTGALAPEARSALDAERRTLQRGIFAMRVAKREAEKRGLGAHDAAHLEVDFMRRGMWPRDRRLDAAEQPLLCEWIFSPEFLQADRVPSDPPRCSGGPPSCGSSDGSSSLGSLSTWSGSSLVSDAGSDSDCAVSGVGGLEM